VGGLNSWIQAIQNYDSSKRAPIIAEMEELLKKLEGASAFLADVGERLREIEKDAAVLEKYYHSDWMNDYEYFKADKQYMVLMEDPIYDCLQEIYSRELSIIKQLVAKLR
jgi:predicted nuclease with TOPRIM domain